MIARPIRAILLAAIAVGFCFSVPAQAAGERFAVAWHVVPQDPLPEAQWVKPYTTFTSARLLPHKLFVLGTDVVGTDGKTVVPAGSELIGLASRARIGCTITPPANKGLGTLIWIGVDRYVCLLDADSDGAFDHYFRRGTPTVGIFAGSGTVPAVTFDIRPAPYLEKPREAVTAAPKVYLQYGWFASLVNELVFQLCLKESTTVRGECLSPDYSVKRTALPGTFSALGGSFRVDAKQDNQVQVTMVAPFRPVPLILSY